MTLQDGFWDSIKHLKSECTFYQKRFQVNNDKTTTERLFVYPVLDRVHTLLRRMLTWVHSNENKIYLTLRSCHKQLMLLALDLAYFERLDLQKLITQIATEIFQLLPEEIIQLSLFDAKPYTDDKVIKKPVFKCFKDWLNKWQDRKNYRDLKRYLKNPNYSYFEPKKSRFTQLNIMGLWGCSTI